MPAYSYTAFDTEGKKLSGDVSAISERDARRLIKDLNLIPLDVSVSFSIKSGILRVKKKVTGACDKTNGNSTGIIDNAG